MKKDHIKLKNRIFDISFVIIKLFCVILLFWLIVWSIDFDPISIPIIGFIYLGFALPQCVGRKSRNKHARKQKFKERHKWGFCSRDRKGVWVYTIHYPVEINADCAKGRKFYSEWLIIENGKIIVNPGGSTVDLKNKEVTYHYRKKTEYSWDGCSPKRYFYWFILLGTLDWWHTKQRISKISDTGETIQTDVIWRNFLHASLVHDALYQYLAIIPLRKQEVDTLFYDMLDKSNIFKVVAWVYYFSVKHFGASNLKNIPRNKNSDFKVKFVP